MAEKKKKKSNKLPYVHIDVLPEEKSPEGAAEAATSQAPSQARNPKEAHQSLDGQAEAAARQSSGCHQLPSETVLPSESGPARQSLVEEDDDAPEQIVPFVMPVFRNSDIRQAMQAHDAVQTEAAPQQLAEAGFDPGQSLSQIQNDLLSRHNAAQQQACRQVMRQHPQGAQQFQANVPQGGQALQGNVSQDVWQSQGQVGQGPQGQQPYRQGMQQQSQQTIQGNPRQSQGMTGAAVHHPQQAQLQRMPQVQATQHSSGQMNQQATQQTQQARQAHQAQMQSAARKSTGQFATTDASQASRHFSPTNSQQTMRSSSANQASPAIGDTMQSAAVAAARSEQSHAQSAFGGVQANGVMQHAHSVQNMQATQGSKQNVQNVAAAQPQQQVQPQQVQHFTSQPHMGHRAQVMGPHSQAHRQAAASAGHAPAPTASSVTAKTQVAPAPTAVNPCTPSSQTSSTSKVGDPLLDAKAIEESPMFDKPPVSIEEGMRKFTSGRKMRRGVLVAALALVAVLALVGAGIVGYTMLSKEGVVPRIDIETKTAPVTPQGSSQGSSAGGSAGSSSSAASSGSSGLGAGDLSGTVVYQYTANTASGVEYKVEETVSFQANGDCQSSTMNMTFPDEASAKTFSDNLARDYGSSFKLDSLNGANVVATIDNSGLHLSRDEYENALRYSVSDLVVLGK